jgi:hypothetical protein
MITRKALKMYFKRTKFQEARSRIKEVIQLIRIAILHVLMAQ